MLRLLVSAGGTGGGVYPALAVVEALVDKVEVLWIGGEDGMEVSLVGRIGIPLKTIPAAGVHGVGVGNLPNNLFRLGKGLLEARRVIQEFSPDVILFTGGYVGIPVSLLPVGMWAFQSLLQGAGSHKSFSPQILNRRWR
jgi:UDP-N-acetylglucosamine--N-acetylmuramyl-(pentapeptide) pyrophosphoryl-undecaprenol N-acetylglucosamine transferase